MFVAGVRARVVVLLLAAAGLAVLWGGVLVGSARALPSVCSHSSSIDVTCTYTSAGSYSFTVPRKVGSLEVTAVGAAGGSGFDFSLGGAGALVKDTAVRVSAGRVLRVVVGGVGGDGTSHVGGAGGKPGGGAGGEVNSPGRFVAAGGGGGGYSGLFAFGVRLVIAAGGGGGGGAGGPGGYGDIGAGGQAGAGGCDVVTCHAEGGRGASGIHGGSGGLANVPEGDGSPGVSREGGKGGATVEELQHPNAGSGGGGGGGLAGGGGGGSGERAGGGGGGSSYGVGSWSAVHATGPASVSITYALPGIRLADQLLLHTGAYAPGTPLSNKAGEIYRNVYDVQTAAACRDITEYKDLVPATNVPPDIADRVTDEATKLAGELGCGAGVGAVSAGGGHTCALIDPGAVKCWGDNAHGQLGDGTKMNSSVPVDVKGLGSGMAAVSAGAGHTCALTDSGAVKCWGYNLDGQLGDGTNTQSSVPVDVKGLGSGVAAISAGRFHTCVLTHSGAVKCWGENLEGQLGDGTEKGSSVPVDAKGLDSREAAITAGGSHTCALSDSGAAKCWGANFSGELGNGTEKNSSLPVDVSGLGSGMAEISAGTNHTCALTDSGAVKCWGANRYGQLGDGTTTKSSVPVDVKGLG